MLFFLSWVVRVVRQGLKVEEIPIFFRDRYDGVSKISRGEIIRAIGNLIRLSVASRAPARLPVTDKTDKGHSPISARSSARYRTAPLSTSPHALRRSASSTRCTKPSPDP